MSFSPVLLITDVLLWLLVAVVALYAWQARRHAHLLAPWIKVRQNPVAMICATVLAAYALVGLADSLHFRAAAGGKGQSNAEIKSVLDLALDAALGPMAGKSEKTYSAPLATHSWVARSPR